MSSLDTWQQEQGSDVLWSNDDDYWICLSCSRAGRRLVRSFMAWGPKDGAWRSRLKAAYGIGEHIPQPRELIDVCSTLQLAMDACEQHREGVANAADYTHASIGG